MNFLSLKKAVLVVASVLLVSSVPPAGGTLITWKTLTDIRYQQRFNEEYELHFMYPIFGPRVKSLDGKQVSIRGYYILRRAYTHSLP